MGTAHLLSQVEGSGTQFAAGRIQCNNVTLTLTQISTPVAFQRDITVQRLATGQYQVNIANFRGPQSFVIPTVTAGSSSTAGGGPGAGINLTPLSTGISACSYATGTDNFGFVIGITSGSTFTDADVYFQAFGF